MYITQALPIFSLFLLTPLTLAAPLAEAEAEADPQAAAGTCPLGKTPFGCTYPDHYTETFLGFTGYYIGKNIPYYFTSATQQLVCPGRVEDTVNRALEIPRVAESWQDYVSGKGDPRNVEKCVGAKTPIFQGTTYRGNQQIYVTWDQNSNPDPTGQTVTYCGYSAPNYDSTPGYQDGCTIPIPK